MLVRHGVVRGAHVLVSAGEEAVRKSSRLRSQQARAAETCALLDAVPHLWAYVED